MLRLIKLLFVLCARYVTCELDTANEEGAVIQGVVSGSLVPRLSPASVMSSLKFQGQKASTVRAAAETWG